MYKMQAKMTSVIFGIILLCGSVNGHGRLLDPPQRSSLWRFYKDIGAPKNYNDNELFCGGFGVQSRNDGKCGTCGDPYDGERENEAGGKYALGFISRTYQKGQTITVTVQLTAAHKGFFEFKICPHNDVHTPVSPQCLDMHPIVIVGQDENPYRYKVGSRSGYYYIQLQLPDDVTCSQCVLQWYYKAGNSAGCDPDGTCCIGCGPQETFVNCADVSIVENGVVTSPPPTFQTITASPWTEQPSTNPPTTVPEASPVTASPSTNYPNTVSSSSTTPVSTPSNPAVTTMAPVTTSPSTFDCDLDYIPDCKGIGIVPPTDLWCTKVCREGKKGCTPDRCSCICVKQIICVPVGWYDTLPGMIDWCNSNCANGACPDSSVCDCK